MDDFRANIIIALLVILLLVTILGINTITIFLNVIEILYLFLINIFSGVFSSLGYITGLALIETPEIFEKTSKFAIDVTADSVKDVGKILIKASEDNTSLDEILKPKKKEGFIESFDSCESKIQTR